MGDSGERPGECRTVSTENRPRRLVALSESPLRLGVFPLLSAIESMAADLPFEKVMEAIEFVLEKEDTPDSVFEGEDNVLDGGRREVTDEADEEKRTEIFEFVEDKLLEELQPLSVPGLREVLENTRTLRSRVREDSLEAVFDRDEGSDTSVWGVLRGVKEHVSEEQFSGDLNVRQAVLYVVRDGLGD